MADASEVPPGFERANIEAFGGAIFVSAPGGWLDASDVRPVPDHQEVWLERAATARALIVELLELAADATDGDAATYWMAVGTDAVLTLDLGYERLLTELLLPLNLARTTGHGRRRGGGQGTSSFF